VNKSHIATCIRTVSLLGHIQFPQMKGVFYPDKLRKTAEIMAAFPLLNAAEQAEMKTVQCRECFMRQAVQGGVNGGGSEIKTAWMFGTCSLDRNSEFCQDKLRTHCLRNCK
jgi:hypothetical protein